MKLAVIGSRNLKVDIAKYISKEATETMLDFLLLFINILSYKDN